MTCVKQFFSQQSVDLTRKGKKAFPSIHHWHHKQCQVLPACKLRVCKYRSIPISKTCTFPPLIEWNKTVYITRNKITRKTPNPNPNQYNQILIHHNNSKFGCENKNQNATICKPLFNMFPTARSTRRAIPRD